MSRTVAHNRLRSHRASETFGDRARICRFPAHPNKPATSCNVAARRVNR